MLCGPRGNCRGNFNFHTATFHLTFITLSGETGDHSCDVCQLVLSWTRLQVPQHDVTYRPLETLFTSNIVKRIAPQVLIFFFTCVNTAYLDCFPSKRCFRWKHATLETEVISCLTHFEQTAADHMLNARRLCGTNY